MAYNGDYLTSQYVGSKGGRHIWFYTTTDIHTDVDAANYFSDGATRGMALGDPVYVTVVDSLTAPTSVTTFTLHHVSAVGAAASSIGAASAGSTVTAVKANATAAPTANDDVDGYAVGSVWVDVTNDQAYVALDVTNGAAKWGKIGPRREVLSYSDISTKGADAAVARFVAPFKFKITKIWSVANAALATGDATLTTAIAGTGVTDGVVTITQAGSAAGDIDSATPSALNTGAAAALVTVTGGGTSTATAGANVYVEFEEVIP